MDWSAIYEETGDEDGDWAAFSNRLTPILENFSSRGVYMDLLFFVSPQTCIFDREIYSNNLLYLHHQLHTRSWMSWRSVCLSEEWRGAGIVVNHGKYRNSLLLLFSL